MDPKQGNHPGIQKENETKERHELTLHFIRYLHGTERKLQILRGWRIVALWYGLNLNILIDEM
jgi:hypothetical protein